MLWRRRHPLGDPFQVALLGLDERAHVAREEKPVGERPQRRAPLDDVAHQRSARVNVKLVLMAQPPEYAAHHLVDEAPRRQHLHDPRDEHLADAEVPSFERDEIPELEQAAHSARRNEALTGKGSALGVLTDVTREVEADLDRNLDYGFDDNLAHVSFNVAVRLKTRRPAAESGSTQKYPVRSN